MNTIKIMARRIFFIYNDIKKEDIDLMLTFVHFMQATDLLPVSRQQI
jgi:hypothetical protein